MKRPSKRRTSKNSKAGPQRAIRGGKDKDKAESVKPKRATPPPPEQNELFPESNVTIKDIEDAARATKDAETQRMVWAEQEKQHRAALNAALIKHGFTVTKGYKRGEVEAWLEASEVKAKCRLKSKDTGE